MTATASYALCQTACNAAVVGCYSAAGLVFGTVTGGVGAPPAAVACNVALGSCMSACAAKFLGEAGVETAATGGVGGIVNTVGGLAVAAVGATWMWWNLRVRIRAAAAVDVEIAGEGEERQEFRNHTQQ